MNRSIRAYLGVFATFLAIAAPVQKAEAWVLVYDMKFQAIGESINFRPYDGGYYLAPRDGDSNGGTLILFRHTGGQKQYYKYENFGEIFYAASNGTNRKAVLTATAANDVSTSTFYAIGDANENVPYKGISGEGKLYVAKELKGYSVSADSERDLPFAGDATDPYDLGVAGATILTCKFNDTYTDDPSKPVSDLATVTEKMIAILDKAGYTDGSPTTGGGTTTSGVTTAGTATGGRSTAGSTTGGSGSGVGN